MKGIILAGGSGTRPEVHDEVGRLDHLAVVLDDRVETAPVIQSRLGADNRITGQFTTDEADELQPPGACRHEGV